MTDQIKLSEARAAVLKAVAAGEVKHRRNWGHDPDDDKWGRKTVTGACTFLRDAGLIKTGPPMGQSMYASKPWQLTEAGEQWLAENGQQP